MIELVQVIALLLATTESAAGPTCVPDGQVTKAIAELGLRNVPAKEQLDVLASQPDVAACHLVRSLRVVRDTHVTGYDQEKHPETMRVVWALRALRYLTDCQDFRAPTAEDPARWEETRRDFLLRDNRGAASEKAQGRRGVKFFQTWMSRDSVFIAPPDAQRSIIRQWLQWYQETGSHRFEYHTCESVDGWYF